MNYLIVMLVVILMINLSSLMAPAMQNLLDVCHNYGAANDILFNPLKSVCIVYKLKYYKLFCDSVNIGSEPLRFVNIYIIYIYIFIRTRSTDFNIHFNTIKQSIKTSEVRGSFSAYII